MKYLQALYGLGVFLFGLSLLWALEKMQFFESFGNLFQDGTAYIIFWFGVIVFYLMIIVVVPVYLIIDANKPEDEL